MEGKLYWSLKPYKNCIYKEMSRTTEAQLSKITKIQNPCTDTGHFYSCNHQNWLLYPILGGKTVENVQIDQQTTKILPKS